MKKAGQKSKKTAPLSNENAITEVSPEQSPTGTTTEITPSSLSSASPVVSLSPNADDGTTDIVVDPRKPEDVSCSSSSSSSSSSSIPSQNMVNNETTNIMTSSTTLTSYPSFTIVFPTTGTSSIPPSSSSSYPTIPSMISTSSTSPSTFLSSSSSLSSSSVTVLSSSVATIKNSGVPELPDLDLDGPYKPGTLTDYPEVIAIAKQIAEILDADFEDAEINRRITSLNVEKQEAEEKLIEARTAYRLDPKYATQSALSLIENKLIVLNRSLEQAAALKAQRYRQNVREMVQKVTISIITIPGTAISTPQFIEGTPGSGLTNEQWTPGGVDGADIETYDVLPPRLICRHCHNDNESSFLHDPKQGEIVCGKCGTIAIDHVVHDGDWVRQFEGEDNTSQIGPASDPTMSNRYNLRTGMVAGIGVTKTRMKQMRIMNEAIELGTSGTTGVMDRRTRISYMDRQKNKAAGILANACDRLHIAQPILDRAKRYFALYRETRQHVQSFIESVTACLIAAYEEAVFYRLVSEREKKLANEQMSEEDRLAMLENTGMTAMTEGNSSSTLPMVPELTEEEKEQLQKRRNEELRIKQDLEDKRDRALGLLGATRMIIGDNEESFGTLPPNTKVSNTNPNGTKHNRSDQDDEDEETMDNVNKISRTTFSSIDDYVDEDELLLQQLEAQRKARGRAKPLDIHRSHNNRNHLSNDNSVVRSSVTNGDDRKDGDEGNNNDAIQRRIDELQEIARNMP